MKKIKILFILILLISCTKEIDIRIPNTGTQFVVNGHIENGQPAKILITRSLPYFDPLNLENVVSSSVRDAQVKISSSNGVSEILSQTNTASHPPIGLGLSDTWYFNYYSEVILGEEGVTYDIEIIKNDTIVTSKTTIPKLAPISVDSLRFLYRADDSSYCYMLGHLNDPDTIGNCYRVFSKTKPIWGSTFDFNNDSFDDFYMSMLEQDGNFTDEYVNGWNFSFPMYKGRGFWQEWGLQESYDSEEVDGTTGATTGFWNVGDSVILKWSSWDRSSWDFWYSLAFNNPAGPFGAPSDANSNISGGLGVFSGTSSQYIELIAQPVLE